MAAKGQPKSGGRQKGSLNKTTEARAYVERVFKLLKTEKRITPEMISARLLTCGNDAVVQKELHSLREYKYGKPMQPNEVTGIDGGPIPLLIVNHIDRPLRA